jgi:hypothetical protein
MSPKGLNTCTIANVRVNSNPIRALDSLYHTLILPSNHLWYKDSIIVFTRNTLYIHSNASLYSPVDANDIAEGGCRPNDTKDETHQD